MPTDNKLYLCFEYCEFDLKKYMKSQQYKLSAEQIRVRPSPWRARPARRRVRDGRRPQRSTLTCGVPPPSLLGSRSRTRC